MKKRIFPVNLTLGAILLMILASGCIHVDYVGQKFSETPMSKKVEYVPQDQEVDTTEYLLIGRFTLWGKDSIDGYDIQKKLMEKAREYGGDAVHVVSLRSYQQGAYTRNINEFGYHPETPQTPQEKEMFGKRVPLKEETMYEKRVVVHALLYKKRTEALKQMGY